MELSPAEQQIVKRIKRAKLFVFLRQHRHTLFDEALQQELATMYKDAPQGHPPIPPGLSHLIPRPHHVSAQCASRPIKVEMVSEPPFT